MFIQNERNMTYANPWKRLVAVIIDGIALSLVTYPLIFLIMGPSLMGLATNADTMSESEAMGFAMGFMGKMFGMYLFIIIAHWLYFALMESSKYQGSLGKMALKIKVTDDHGNRITFLKATGRFFGKMISAMIMYIGFIMILFTDKKQGLHDMMASTLVLEAGEEYQTYDDDEEEF